MTEATNAADRIAVQDVLLSYAAGVDERDFELYRSCFADDVLVTGFGPDDYHGAESWVTYVKGALSKYGPTQHMLGPMLATITGDSADTRSDVQALHCLTGDDEGKTMTLWATYKTQMQRIDGRWQIVRHELVARTTKVA